METFVPIASCLVTGHHWKERDSVLFVSSLQVLMYIDKIPPEMIEKIYNSIIFLIS